VPKGALRTGEVGQSWDNRKMDAGRSPSFADMYADYFHEDWRLEDPSADDVVRRYRRFAPQTEVDHLAEELTGLLVSHPSEEALRADLGSIRPLRPCRGWAERSGVDGAPAKARRESYLSDLGPAMYGGSLLGCADSSSWASLRLLYSPSVVRGSRPMKAAKRSQSSAPGAGQTSAPKGAPGSTMLRY